MKKTFILLIGVLLAAGMQAEQQKYVGGDISMLPLYEQHNQPYRDAYGKKIDNPLTWFVSACGWNTFRVRLFVDPDKTDPSLSQDLAYVTALGKRIKDAGAYFMLDFHYSDTWVDATHIQAPKAWKGKSDADMAAQVGTYTHEVLQALKNAGATPDLVQVGNEIMYGLCDIKVAPYEKGDSNWSGYLGLLKAGCDAVRDECPQAQIIIHTDRPANSGYNRYYYNKLVDANIAFDIIGLSYYPFWHGYLTDDQVKSKTDKNNLVKALKQLAVDFPTKRVHIVECAYNFDYWPSKGVNYDTRDVWPCSKEGQYNFVKDLVDELRQLDNVDGINYWFPEEAGNGDDTDWNTSKGTVLWTWQNRGFWNPNNTSSGHAINRTAQPSESVTAASVCAPYYMRTFLGDEPSAISYQPSEIRYQKILRDGQIQIICDQKIYNVLGEMME
jgi:arabinogalactan endo-1,4-beta-galactosidase